MVRLLPRLDGKMLRLRTFPYVPVELSTVFSSNHRRSRGSAMLHQVRCHFVSILSKFRSCSRMTSPFTGGLAMWDTERAFSSSSIQPLRKICDTFVETGSMDNSVSGAKGKETIQPGSTNKNTIATSSQNTIDVLTEEFGPPPKPSTLSLEERFQLCLSVGEECIQPEELKSLLSKKAHPICYDGFEPSGRMHIAQGLLKAIFVNRLTQSGCVFVFWVADWFAMMNNKMGGDLTKIRVVGEYFIEVWKALGMDMTNVRFLWCSEQIAKHSIGYWERVMDIARSNTITRVKRCCQIMGRSEGDAQPAAHILYPCMQCADVFFLRADICQLGMDQRKVNMLAREYAEQKKLPNQPVILSHKMMPGLLQGQAKMSKSDPDSAIFMEDAPQDVNRKIKKAFCPPNQIEDNPCVAYVEMLIFPRCGEFLIERKESNGGNSLYSSVEAFKAAYAAGDIHPGDLKPALAKKLNEIIQPVRDHFQEDAHAKALLAKIRKF